MSETAEPIHEFLHGHLLPGRPSIRLSQDGKIAHGHDGLAIEYAGADDCPYGRSATNNRKKFAAIVLHHTAPDHDTDWYVKYQIKGDKERGGHFGYHFYVSPDGRVVQGAPFDKRTNHVNPERDVRRDFGLEAQNTNAIGISCVGAGKPTLSQPTKMQIERVRVLVFALCDVFNIPFTSVFGHGEVQTNRMKSEGTAMAREIRAWRDDPAPSV